MKTRLGSSMAACGSLVVLASACTSSTTGPAGTSVLAIAVGPATSLLDADLRSTQTLTATVRATRGQLPGSATIRFTSTVGVLVIPGAGADGGPSFGPTASLPMASNGSASVEFRCASAAQQPVQGVASVTAILENTGSDDNDGRTSTPVTITCQPVADTSSLAFVTPTQGEEVNDPTSVAVTIQAVDFDGNPAAEGSTVLLDRVTGGAKVSTDALATTGDRLPLTLAADASGLATFYVLYPGDEAATVPLPYTFSAKYTNSLRKPALTAERTIVYRKASDDSSISFDSIAGAGMARVLPNTATGALAAAVSAGNTLDEVTISVQLVGRDGRSVPAGTRVVFSCTAENGAPAANCNALTGASPFLDGGAVQEGLPSAVVLSTLRAATATRPAASIASVTYKTQTGSTPGEVRIGASFTPPSSSVARSTQPDLAASIRLVDQSTVTLAASLTPAVIASDQSSNLKVSLSKGVSALANKEVCVTIDEAGFTRAFMNDSDDDTRSNLAMVRTDALGEATVAVVPVNAVTRGLVTLKVVAVDLDYDRTRDTSSQPCRASDPSAQTTEVTLNITREPVLQALVYVGATPTVIGVQGSAITSTSRVQFQLFNDENQPVVNQQVSFTLDPNSDPAASVTPFAATDSTGTATAFLLAGGQAAPLTVRARATRSGTTVTSSANPVSVVGGKPAWGPTQIGVVGSPFVWSEGAVSGYEQPFGPVSRPDPTTLHIQLADRFTNRVQKPYEVQVRVESGSVQQSVTTDTNGLGVVSYIAGPVFALERNAQRTEAREIVRYRESHSDAPQPVTRIAQPSDGKIQVLFATRGEESFQDVNGDGLKQATEAFTDLPEPFLDRNGDGLRANCDLPLSALPVHNDPVRRQYGVGSYCNPYFDGDVTPNSINPLTSAPFTAAECREHWCPDWDRQWNCSDQANAAGKTPEAQRAVWCPTWQFRELESVSTFINGAPQDTVSIMGVGYRVGQIFEDNHHMLPGITGLVLGDDTPPATGTWGIRIRRMGTTVDAALGPAVTTGAPSYGSITNITALCSTSPTCTVVLSAGGANVTLQVELSVLEAFLSQGGISSAEMRYRVAIGDLRAPFSDFDRTSLRNYQTDQFIDGNNNGVWDDVNGQFDEDVLIWKTLNLVGNSDVYFSRNDWRAPAPLIQGRPSGPTVAQDVVLGCTGLAYDRMHSFLHVCPSGNTPSAPAQDVVSPTDHSGGSDFFYHESGFGTTLLFRLVDINGNPVCPYNSTTVRIDTTGPMSSQLTGSCSPAGLFGVDLVTAADSRDATNFKDTPASVLITYSYDTKAGRVVQGTLLVKGLVRVSRIEATVP